MRENEKMREFDRMRESGNEEKKDENEVFCRERKKKGRVMDNVKR